MRPVRLGRTPAQFNGEVFFTKHAIHADFSAAGDSYIFWLVAGFPRGRIGGCFRVGNGYRHPNQHRHPYPIADPHIHINRHRHAHPDSNSYTDRDTHPHRYRHPDTLPYPNRDTNTATHPANGDKYPVGTGADSDVPFSFLPSDECRCLSPRFICLPRKF